MLRAALLVTTLLAATHAVAAGGGASGAKKTWHKDSITFAADASVKNALGHAARTWNNVGAGPEIGVVAGDAGSFVVAVDGVNRAGVLTVWPYNPQIAALTTVWSNGDEIVEVDLAVNPAFASDSRVYDMQNVLTHELGHALGLPDVKDRREATMFYLVLPGETLKSDLSRADEDALLELYGFHPTTGCNEAGKEIPAMALVALIALSRRRTR